MKKYVFQSQIIFVILFMATKCFEGSYDNNNYRADYHQPVDQKAYLNKIKEISQKCLNLSGKKISSEKYLNMTLDEKLEAFKNSNCPPVIILPGFMGSKLEFRMKNCTEFEKFHPNILKSCGWTNCNDPKLKRFDIWINSDLDTSEFFEIIFNEEKKYKKISSKVYIPHFFKQIIINDKIVDYHHRDECYGNLFRIYYIKDENKYKISNLKGAQVNVMKSKKCGIDVVSNYLGDMMSLSRQFQGFFKLDEFLLTMGYIRGMSLFYHPYDFRIPISNLMRRVDNTVKLAYRITKKKPILIGHSFGGLLAYKYVSNLENKNFIEEVITIGTPFLGTFSAIADIVFDEKIIDIEKSVNIFGYDVKIKAQVDGNSSILIRNTFPSLHFLPRNIKEDEIDNYIIGIEDFNKLENNLDYMSKDKEIYDYFFSIFPKKSSNCKSIPSRNTKINSICKINYKDFNNYNLIDLKGEKIKIGKDSQEFKRTYKNILSKNLYILNRNIHENFKLETDSFINHLFDDQEEEIFKFQNPEVPFTFIYSNHIDTPNQIIMEEEKNVEYGPGDGTVGGFSQIYPGLRWLFENYKNQKANNHIHFVEYCAHYNEKNVNTYKKEENQFISLSCDCIDQTNLNPKEICEHKSMIGDTKLISFIGDLILKSKSKVQKINNYEELYNEIFKKNLMCSHLN